MLRVAVCLLALVILVSSLDVGGAGDAVNSTVSTVTGTLSGLPIGGVLQILQLIIAMVLSLLSGLPGVGDVIKQLNVDGLTKTLTSVLGGDGGGGGGGSSGNSTSS
ncbi:unnamed protein product [Nippostrongylus brasiliensis]|uniref:Secreted protein n=1 Tax=Nippostrongylus brasiliensis TaxID=27835 RepID=A0A0N4YEC6_NIPBR|nr:hypothetical protein Q1695_007606 [Nippostrongylus brasiliensis]VDL78628.1 unnamed protein product [Nippostrongylus brasiliensis]